MSLNKTDLVGEYLGEVDLRLSGLPLLQRRELLADLEAHIATAREQGAYSESEMIEVLQRLGSPEAIAAAAYWEAGPQPPRDAPPRPPQPKVNVPAWVIGAIVGFVLLFLIGVAGLFFFARVDGAPAPETAVVPAEQWRGPDAGDSPRIEQLPVPPAAEDAPAPTLTP